MKRLKIDIKHDRCVGDGLCRETAPNTFAAGPEGRSVVVDPQGDEAEHIEAAAEECRLDAITLIDAETGKRVWPPD